MKKNNMIKSYVNLMVGIPLMGAAAGQVNTLPVGIAKDISGTAVGLQSIALVGNTLGNSPFKFKKK